MAESDDIEQRISAVEREIAGLREELRRVGDDASAARTLAAGADRDVAELRAQLRAHTRVLNALRETQLEMRVEMNEMRAELRGEIDGLRTEMRAGFSTMATGMAQITALLTDRD